MDRVSCPSQIIIASPIHLLLPWTMLMPCPVARGLGTPFLRCRSVCVTCQYAPLYSTRDAVRHHLASPPFCVMLHRSIDIMPCSIVAIRFKPNPCECNLHTMHARAPLHSIDRSALSCTYQWRVTVSY